MAEPCRARERNGRRQASRDPRSRGPRVGDEPRRGERVGDDERARERAAAERLQIAFHEGDAERLPFPDASFDVVLSTFGAMFAPNQEQAAKELLRVCRPGGKIGMANWTPDSLPGEIFRVTARHVPPPPGLKLAMLWGTEERLRELFG